MPHLAGVLHAGLLKELPEPLLAKTIPEPTPKNRLIWARLGPLGQRCWEESEELHVLSFWEVLDIQPAINGMFNQHNRDRY